MLLPSTVLLFILQNPPPGLCYICGDLQWMRFCPAKKKLTCKNCGKVGHEVTRCWYVWGLKIVEKRKISYFVLARNLIQH